ncbi:MAG: branched-chain amino acid transporter [Burkholderia sp.]|nr:branched-chain amino acid transporter [Burkholderia sp.]
MSAADVWITIILLTLATLLTRGSFFILGNAVKLPPKVQHALRYAPATALAAVVIPDLVSTGGTISMSLMNPKLLAGIGAALFFFATRRLLETIIVGMALFTVLRLVL